MTHVNERVTVIWHCAMEACLTGTVIGVSDRFVQVRGLVPTFAESLSCTDGAAVQLDTYIPLARVCAVMEHVPACRKAGLPDCCVALDPSGSHRSGPRP